jgi:DNA polymerase elongation subunit (family B)
MYRRIYYDGSKIYLWETLPDGKRNHETIHQEIEYYIPDKKGISHIKDIFGHPVIKQVSKTRYAVNKLKSCGVKCCETDIPETIKFLQKRYAGVDLKPDISIFKIGALDIEIETGTEFPDATEAKYPINLITLRNFKSNKTYTFASQKYTGDSKTVDNYVDCSSEEELLINFLSFVRHCNFDIITGWNVLDFDIRYIHNRLKVYGIEKTMSPIDVYYVDEKNNITIGGINILDYQQMYKEFLKITLSSYSLNYVSLLELGEGKLELEGSINQIYKTEWNRFVEYNINDVDLVHKLDKKLKLINLCVTLAYQALIPFEKTLATIPVVEGYFLKALHAHNMVMNDRTTDSDDREEYTGGYVHAKPGFYKHVLSFDVESMYPHLIMQFNISPETIVLNPANTEGLIRSTVKGVYYRKDIEGFIPQMVKGIFKDRKRYKNMMNIMKLHEKGLDAYTISKRLKLKLDAVERKLDIIFKEKETVSYYDLQQYVRKILINSIYGAMANPYFHYFNINNAKSVTVGGQTLIQHLSKSIDDFLMPKYELKKSPTVIIDTDSCYINMHPMLKQQGIQFGNYKEEIDYFVKYIDDEFSPVIATALNGYAATYNTEQLINFKHEKIITKQAVIVKKHYISQVIYSEGDYYDPPKMKYVGVQIVRSDTPEFCRKKLKGLIDLIFDSLDREKVISEIFNIREEFLKAPIGVIASTKGLGKYNDYARPVAEYVERGVYFPLHCPIQIQAAISYNFMIEKFKLPLLPAHKGVKIKYVYVNNQNIAQTHVIGFLGKWPEEFTRHFKIDQELQFEKTFMPVIEDLFTILGWEEVTYEQSILEEVLS